MCVWCELRKTPEKLIVMLHLTELFLFFSSFTVLNNIYEKTGRITFGVIWFYFFFLFTGHIEFLFHWQIQGPDICECQSASPNQLCLTLGAQSSFWMTYCMGSYRWETVRARATECSAVSRSKFLFLFYCNTFPDMVMSQSHLQWTEWEFFYGLGYFCAMWLRINVQIMNADILKWSLNVRQQPGSETAASSTNSNLVSNPVPSQI